MDIQTLVILIIIGLLAGFAGGIAGVGGGIIVIPALILVLGMSQYSAQGTNLAMMIPPIGILAAYNYYKEGYVNLKFSLVLAISFIIGGWLGSKVAVNLPQETLKKIFGVLLMAMAIKFILNK
ncbi:MAG: sulfite exporter TauE/SafE family protein [Bacteroidota bacterium]